MFTGLIEHVGRIAAIDVQPSGARVRITTTLASELAIGESVAVDGVCLTVVAAADGEMQADLGPETLAVTTLGSLRRERAVNLERAMRAGERFGGHFVQGHVDGVGTVSDVRADGESHWISVEFPAGLAPLLIAKGSIAVQGVSLTVARLHDTSFDLMIIPYTWTHTALADLRVGDRVNLECDMIGKYVARAIQLQR